MNVGSLIPRQEKQCCDSERVHPTSILENLQAKRDRLQEQLNKTDAAIKALEENPKVAEVLELVGRAI